jgi:hypothetical protein
MGLRLTQGGSPTSKAAFHTVPQGDLPRGKVDFWCIDCGSAVPKRRSRLMEIISPRNANGLELLVSTHHRQNTSNPGIGDSIV